MPSVDELRSKFKAYGDYELRELAADGEASFTAEAWGALQAELQTRTPIADVSSPPLVVPQPASRLQSAAPADRRLGAYIIDDVIALVPAVAFDISIPDHSALYFLRLSALLFGVLYILLRDG